MHSILHKLPKVRLLIGTKDTADIERFYVTVVRPSKANLSDTVSLWHDRLLEEIWWLARRPKGPWRWTLRSKHSRFQTWYSRQDELLADLQDQQFRGVFEQSYSLWLDYGQTFVTTLHYPEPVDLLIRRTPRKAKELIGKDPSLDHLSTALHTFLIDPRRLLAWWNAQDTDRKEPPVTREAS